MIEFMEALLTALGLKLKVVAGAALGSFISLRFFDGLSIYERWMTFVSGLALSAYLTEPLLLLLELRDAHRVEAGAALVLGIFGMAIVAAVIRVIRETDWTGFIRLPGGGK